jgi:hypothetical protein
MLPDDYRPRAQAIEQNYLKLQEEQQRLRERVEHVLGYGFALGASYLCGLIGSADRTEALAVTSIGSALGIAVEWSEKSRHRDALFLEGAVKGGCYSALAYSAGAFSRMALQYVSGTSR